MKIDEIKLTIKKLDFKSLNDLHFALVSLYVDRHAKENKLSFEDLTSYQKSTDDLIKLINKSDLSYSEISELIDIISSLLIKPKVVKKVSKKKKE